MSAEIHKIGDHPTDPHLLLEMVKANFDDIDSVVVSIIRDGSQYTYWTQMDNANLAFHAYSTQRDLIDAIEDDSNVTA